MRKVEGMGSCGETDDGGSVPPLARMCLRSLADNMKDVWVKDYADHYLDQYSFRHIMGPFNLLRESVRAYLTVIQKRPLPAPALALRFGTAAHRCECE